MWILEFIVLPFLGTFISGIALGYFYVFLHSLYRHLYRLLEAYDMLETVLLPLAPAGALFLTASGFSFIGVGSAAKLSSAKETDTRIYLTYLALIGVISFCLSMIIGTGPLCLFFTCAGVTIHLGIIGMLSMHYSYPHYETLPMYIAPVYVLLMLFAPKIQDMMVRWRIFGHLRYRQMRHLPDHERQLKKVVDFGVDLSKVGIGLLSLGTWADLISESPLSHSWLSIYTGTSFWLFYGSRLLKKGILYEVWVCSGATIALSMLVTSILYVLFPGGRYEHLVLSSCAIVVVYALEWSRLQPWLDGLFW